MRLVLEDIGDVPFEIIYPVLQRCKPLQLLKVERANVRATDFCNVSAASNPEFCFLAYEGVEFGRVLAASLRARESAKSAKRAPRESLPSCS